MARLSKVYTDLLKQGPFPGIIDLWGEDAHYFHQLHGRMMGFIAEQMQPDLLALGYQAGCEASLQIIDQRIPDIYIRRREGDEPPPAKWDYGAAAATIMAEPGLLTDVEIPQLDAVYIYELASNDLVTIIEVVSPGNKSSTDALTEYRARRDHILSKGVNVVELDLTRSKRHLLEDHQTHLFAYHYAIYLPGQEARLIGMPVLEPLKRVAIPLRKEVVGLEPQPTYDAAYHQVLLAGHILRETDYHAADLPQTALLTSKQRSDALEQATAWKTRLKALLRQTHD
jgi:hypothetical protein